MLLEELQCSIETLGAVVLAQLFTRLDLLVKAAYEAPNDTLKFKCAEELLEKIKHFQQELKNMSKLLTDETFLKQYPADLQDVLRSYGKNIGEMEDVLSHGRNFEEGPLQTLAELATEVMRRTAPSSPAPQKPLPPTPAGRPALSHQTEAQAAFLRRRDASRALLRPLVDSAGPTVTAAAA